MQKDAQKKHQEVIEMIEKLSEATASEQASTVHNLNVFHMIHTYCFTDQRTLFWFLQ
jgi:hypothetical protein